jgi:hypothetical protein
MSTLRLLKPTPVEDRVLLSKSFALWPDSEYNRTHWLAAIHTLRTKTKKGWLIDKTIPKRSEPL